MSVPAYGASLSVPGYGGDCWGLGLLPGVSVLLLLTVWLIYLVDGLSLLFGLVERVEVQSGAAVVGPVVIGRWEESVEKTGVIG